MTFEAMISEAVKSAVREVLREERGAAQSDLLTYDEAAAFAKVSKSTVEAWKKAGVLPVQKRGRVCRVLRSDLLKAMATTEAAPTSADDRVAEILARRSRRRGA